MKLKRLLFLTLCLILLLTSSVFPLTLSVAASESEATYSKYDYSRPGSYFNTVLTASDVIDYLANAGYGYQLSDEERAYLDTYCDFKIYFDRVTNQNVRIEENNGLTEVIAESHTYIASNGDDVKWIPKSVKVVDKDGFTIDERAFGDAPYVANYGSLTIDDTMTVSVAYEFESPFSILASDINAFINLTYDEAGKNAEFVDYYVKNKDGILAYYKYLDDDFIYTQKLEAYNAYLEESTRYNSDLEVYEAYVVKLEEYLSVKENNDNYEENLKKYESDMIKYDKYISDLALMDEQIQNLNDGLMGKVAFYDSFRQLYGCFFANLVDKVVDKKDMLNKFVRQDAIDDCANASKNIREILKPSVGKAYVDLSTNEEKYAFYLNNYQALRDNIVKLTRALHYIYSNDAVRIGIRDVATAPPYNEEDYTEKLAIFISQLIYLSNALSDEPVMDYLGKKVMDENIVVKYRDKSGTDHERTIAQTLGADKNFVKDTGKATPISVVEVQKPAKPEILPEPPKPAEVLKPTPPTVVQHPGDKPVAVSKPQGLSETFDWYEFINDPAKISIIQGVVSALKAGDIAERAELSENVSFKPTLSVEKRRSAEIVTVTFAAADKNVIYSTKVDKGSAVEFDTEYPLPTKAEDISATYVFDTWVTADGETYNLYSVTEDVMLYPSFTSKYKPYDVLNGYLEVAVPEEELTRLPLTNFTSVVKKNRAGLKVKAKNAALSIEYSVLSELESLRVSYLDIDVNTSVVGNYSCRVTAYDASDAKVDTSAAISLSIPCTDTTFGEDSGVTYTDANGSVSQVKKKYASGMIEIPSVLVGADYSVTVRYSIKPVSTIADAVSLPEDALPGSTVTVEFNVPPGKQITGLHYLLAPDYSVKYPIEGNSFVMPFGNVTVKANISDIEYTVKFESDGKVIAEKNNYKYGDTVTVPNPPTKIDDDEYSYKFIGWSPEVSETVTGSVTYVAQFEKTPLPAVEKKFSMFNFIFYTAITLFVLGIIMIVLLILNKKKVISIKGMFLAVGRLFRRKKKAAEDNVAADDEANYFVAQSGDDLTDDTAGENDEKGDNSGE